jgi:hypothetical protein
MAGGMAAGGAGGMMGPMMGMMGGGGGGEKKEAPIAMINPSVAPMVDMAATPISTDPAKKYMAQISGLGGQQPPQQRY